MITVSYGEQPGSPSNQANLNGDTTTRILLCDWADRFTLMRELIGPPGELLEDYTPQENSPDIIALTASSSPHPGKIDGTGVGSRIAVYDKAIVTVNYGVAPYRETEDQQLYSESWEGIIEFITLDHRAYRWGNGATGDALAPDEAPGMQVRSGEYVLTRYGLVTIPNTAGLEGRVNNAVFSSKSLGRDFAAETLLFTPPTLDRSMSIIGTDGWTVVQRLAYRENGWNKFYRSTSGAYESIYVKGGAVIKPYPTADFSPVWS